MTDALAFVLRGAGGWRFFDGPGPQQKTAERLLEEAFERLAREYMHQLRYFKLQIESEHIPWTELANRLEDREDLTADELAQLLIAFSDDVDPGELQGQIRSQIINDDGK